MDREQGDEAQARRDAESQHRDRLNTSSAQPQPMELRPLSSDNRALDVTLSLIGGQDGTEPHPSGSAVFIAPGLALTACHVLRDYWDKFDESGRWSSDVHGGFSIQAVQYQRSGPPRYWHVFSAWHSDPLDIATLELVPVAQWPSGEWPYVTLDLSPPIPGETVCSAGFPASNVVKAEDGHWELVEVPMGSCGQVIDVAQGYQSSMKPFPCYSVEMSIKSGMSGGPVFDKVGHLRGVICSSLELALDEVPLAYVSTLWPAMALRGDPSDTLGDPASVLIDLARSERILCANHNRVLVGPSRDVPSGWGFSEDPAT